MKLQHFKPCQSHKMIFKTSQPAVPSSSEVPTEEKKLDKTAEVIDQVGEKRLELQKELNESIKEILPEYQKYLKLIQNLKTKFQIEHQSVYENVEYFGQTLTVVLEKNGPDLTSSNYLNFENLDHRGQEISSIQEWIKQNKPVENV